MSRAARFVRVHRLAILALVVIGLLDVVLCTSCRQTPQRGPIPKVEDALDGPPLLRVEIASGIGSAEVHVDGPYRIVLDEADSQALRGKRLQRRTIRPAPQGLILDTQRLEANKLSLVPAAGQAVGVGSRRYRGTVTVHRASANALNVVNVIDVDALLDGVVGAEMPARWPLAALEAQAVAGRTFLLYRKATRHDKIVHVRRHDVRYLGIESETARTRRAVDQTSGVVLVYQRRMFPAYFMATCGGHTTSVSHAFGEPEIAPLAGVKCGYCEDGSFYTWTCRFGKNDIAKRLGLDPGEVLRSIRPAASPSGYADHIMVETNRAKRSFGSYRFRAALGPDKLKSTAFTVTDAGRTLEFAGRGWGHGVGLCQWGARGLAQAHEDWPGILRYFFPQSELVRIY